MTTEEFNQQFDILYNNIASNAAPGLNEYEKSVFLTNAQDAFVASSYSGRNAYGFSFEEKEELREALDALVRTVNPTELTASEITALGLSHPLDSSKEYYFYKLESGLLYIIFEEVKFSSYISGCIKDKTALVVPTTHDELWHRMKNPFRGTSKSRVLRLNVADNVVELISDYPIGSYLLRYVEEPKPIILTDLSDYDLSIKGETDEMTCALPEFTHQTILENAVQAAFQIYNLGKPSSSRS